MALKSLQLITTIDGEKRIIDLYGDEDITLEMSFAEIQDITKKNSTYTQSFNVPGSKNNNDIFNHFYDPASTPTTYDVRRTFSAYFTYNGNIILDGYIRLNSSTNNRTEKNYNLTFYTEVGDLSSNIGDKFLYDLNLADLVIPYNSEEIRKSQFNWDTIDVIPDTDPVKNEKVYFPLLFSGYDYVSGDTIDFNASPLLSFNSGNTGSFVNRQYPLPFNYYRPAISVRELYTQIVNQAGYNIDSSFLDTSYFKRFFLPLTFASDGLPLTQSYVPELETEQFSTGGLPYKTPVRFTDTQSGGTSSYLRASFRDVIKDNFSATTNPQVLFLEQPGTYTIRFNAIAGKRLGIDPTLLYTMFIWLHKLDNYPTLQNVGTTIYFDEIINAGPSGFTTFNFELELQGGSAYTFDYVPGGGTGDTNSVLIQFSTELISGPRQVSGNTIDFRLELPEKEYKQIDFIQSVNRTFNMVVVPKVNEEKTLIIEPMIDFIGKGSVLDWTQKVDADSSIMITPITTIIDGTLFYNTRGDSDVGNTTFKNATNRPYGSQYILLNQDYKDKQTIFETLFCSSVDGGLNNLGGHLTIPQAALVKSVDIDGVSTQLFNAYRTLPRMIFKGTYTPIENWGYVPYYSRRGTASTYKNSGYTYNHRFSTYPQAFTGFSHYTNYNSTDSFDPNETMFVEYPNLYDIYYKDYILDLTDEGNRLLSASVFLTPEEIKNIQFNEKILYKNQYYRLNKLSNYSLLEPSIADVELVKLTRDYTPHPVLCVKITDCSNPSFVLYSNTDLNYGFLAYVNRYVSFNWGGTDFCGYVEIVDCGEVENFSNILGVQSQYTDGNGRVPIYDNCGCTNYTGISITQEVIPSPTPTPTPSNTPTPTSPPPSPTRTPTTTPTPSVSPAPQFMFNYVFENCDIFVENPFIILGSYSALTGSTAVSYNGGCYELIASTSQVATETWYNTFSSCTECNSTTPTPTPSNTPTITPTSSPVPFCVCKEYYIENNNPEAVGFTYIDCDGNPQYTFIPDYDNITLCACQGSVISISAPLLVVELGDCSITPTPTPSAGECVCREYIITNEGEAPAIVFYTDCYGNPQSFTMPPLVSTLICGCLGSFYSESGLVLFINNNFCVPITPTQTSTPTYTPTPTSTPQYLTPTPTPSVSPTNTATPTITPTNTSTPTITPSSLGCFTYDVENPNYYDYTTEYTDCAGNVIVFTIPRFSSVIVCARQNSVVNTFFTLNVVLLGTCPLPTPSMTPTNTSTPTITPTITPTNTNTPSITPSTPTYLFYEATRCDVLFSPTFILRTTFVVSGVVSVFGDPVNCYEIIGITPGPLFDYEINTQYADCISCIPGP